MPTINVTFDLPADSLALDRMGAYLRAMQDALVTCDHQHKDVLFAYRNGLNEAYTALRNQPHVPGALSASDVVAARMRSQKAEIDAAVQVRAALDALLQSAWRVVNEQTDYVALPPQRIDHHAAEQN